MSSSSFPAESYQREWSEGVHSKEISQSRYILQNCQIRTSRVRNIRSDKLLINYGGFVSARGLNLEIRLQAFRNERVGRLKSGFQNMSIVKKRINK